MGAYDYTPPSTGGGLYLKLDDGEEAMLRIASEPVVFQSVFETPEGKVNVSSKFAWVVYNMTAEAAQVMQTSATVYLDIKALHDDEEYGDPSKYNIKMKRIGKGLETRYQIIPGTNRNPLTPEQQEAVDSIDLIESVEKGKGTQNINWVRDLDPNGRDQVDNNPLPTRDINEDTPETPGDPLTDEDDKPINLDEIPF